ncbi:MAG: TonB-dependent receptor plug domain-containing protein [Gemmatimonadetes bacterium]|nr:TonB-dependent receptor plug domain-containing protein [Gemmatimonadota bacterium]
MRPDTVPTLLPLFPAAVPPGPLPAGTRYTFTADSLVFSNIVTLSDLLAHIPGVYVARAGFVGQAEPVLYGGRGAQGLEVYWDGVPYLPLGRDSVFLDPARISLAAVERVEVIVLPAALRVYLVSARHRSTEPQTEVRIATGELGIANYHGAFARRWRSGVGLTLKADWNSLDGESAITSSTTSFSSTDLWVKADYVPTDRFGASYQVLSSSWKRAERVGLVQGWKAKRRDESLRLFLAARSDGLGPRAELTLARASVDRDSVVDTLRSEREITQGILALSHAWSRGSAGVALRFQGSDRPFQVETRMAWMPVRGVVLSADGRHATYGQDRSGNRLHLAAGLRLPLGFSLHGDEAFGNDLQAPAIPGDSAQETTDYSGAVRWQSRVATIQVGAGRRAPYVPVGFASGVRTVDHLGPTPRTDYVTTQASIRPLPGLELAGWYADAVGGGADFEPAHHARYSATFYSKFWRVYKSGVFALRAEIAAESWSIGASQGLGGRDTSGAQLPLRGATFIETNVEMRIVGVTVYWVIRSLNGMRGSYVDGLGYPKQIQFYGARWTFAN